MTVQAPAFTSTAPQSKLTCNLQIGSDFTYCDIAIRIKKNGVLVSLANLPKEVSRIELVSNLGVVRDYNFGAGNESPLMNPLQSYLLSKGFAARCYAGDGTTPIETALLTFDDPTRPTRREREVLQLGTVGINTLQLNVYTRGQITPTADVYDCTAWVTFIRKAYAYGFFEQHTMTTVNLINGIMRINTLARDNDWFRAIFMTSKLDRVAVWVDNVRTHDIFRDTARRLMTGTQNYKEDPNAFVLPFDATGEIADQLPMVFRDATGRPTGNSVASLVFECTSTAIETVQVLQVVHFRGTLAGSVSAPAM